MSSKFSSEVPDCVVEKCYEYEGVIMPNIFPIRGLRRLRKFVCRPDDLFIVTYPKSGTTWAMQLTMLVQFEGDTTKLEETKHVVSMVPFLETIQDKSNISTSPLGIDVAEAMTSPRIMKTHSLCTVLPQDIATDDPKPKVLYIARNPKDAAVSYYNFCRYVGHMPSYESWEVYFEEFLAHRTPWGSWFKNVLPWWRRRNHPNVLFLKYEDMKKDLPGAVRQIAEFMGKSLSEDVIQKIAEASTFGAMKSNPNSNPDNLHKKGGSVNKTGEGSFMRKGEVGDWKNYFTDDQNRKFAELYEKEMAGSELEMDFE